jgi:hypothetical protein
LLQEIFLDDLGNFKGDLVGLGKRRLRKQQTIV